MRTRKITELSEIEFRGSLGDAFHAYSEELYALARYWQFELDMAASDAQAAMEALHGHPLLLGLNARYKARRVAKRARRAQNLAYGLAQEARRFHSSYVHHIVNQARK